MTQPTFVPIAEADQVRPARHLHVPGPWMASRPAEATGPVVRRGRALGTPGPDSGFALRLARRFEDELQLDEGESAEDVLLGVALVGAKKAALFGRAPCVYDVRFALDLWGFLGDPGTARGASDTNEDRRATRKAAFSGVSHDYVAQRALVDSVTEEALRRTPDEKPGDSAVS
jgi:hypothetical protein